MGTRAVATMLIYYRKKFINPSRAKLFRGNIRYIFTFYVIPPHWDDTGGSIYDIDPVEPR